MPDIKNSILLDKLIEYAKNLGQKKSNELSAERFLVAVCDLINGSFTIDGSQESKKRMTVALGAAVADIDLLERTLIRCIDESSIDDSIYIQRKMYEARSKAEKDNNSELLPETLLELILKTPTKTIKSMLGENAGKAPSLPERTESVTSSEETAELVEEQTVVTLTEKVKKVRDQLSEVVFGQENAINIFSLGYFQAERRLAIDPKNTRPCATFLFAGPPGVGKTFFAEKAAEMLGLPFKRFDMSEYADSLAHMDLIGYNENYKSPKEGLLTGFVRKNPKCILLFDEIEKAHSNTIHLFLQVLDAGHLTDGKTESEVQFGQTMIFFTTNAGKELYNSSETGDFSAVSTKVILKSLQQDINSYTGQPFFPAAICSRFATGNVVMFNCMTANSLCSIARGEAERFIKNFGRKYGITVSVGAHVYSALLFSEGGAADARTIKSRAERFFDDEIFELLRLISADGKKEKLSALDSVEIEVDLPQCHDIAKYFVNDEQNKVVLFSPDQRVGCDMNTDGAVEVIVSHDMDGLEKLLQETQATFVIVDFDFIEKNGKHYLNIEDISSVSRDAFRLIREKFPDIPVYISQRKNYVMNIEEQRSFINNGTRGFIELNDDFQLQIEKVHDICEFLYQQNSMRNLAKSNNLIRYQTGQTVSEDGKHARITLFDFKLSTAVDAEDTGNIMSNISKPNVHFDEVIGAEKAKEELQFFIEYLKDPKKYSKSGLRAPKGVLLYGPPGTGKTMLAKATACEAGVTFISAEGNQFIKKYVGEGKDALHDLFSVARKYSPSILFIDEFEAIAKERIGGEHSAANGEDVLTALLTEMDGFNTDVTKPVFVLAATNFDVRPGSGKSLDRALLRRFDSLIYVDLPNKSERERFIRLRISENPSFEISEEEIENIVVRSTGMSLADLHSVIDRSLRAAVRTDDHKVTDKVLDEAFESFIGGEEKKWEMSQLERVARHEAGHAFLCWKSGETPSYVTIVARGDHGGYMQHDSNEGKGIYTREELMSRIRTSLGGRASEIVYYGENDGISTGASGDLASATYLAQQIICTYGMDEKFGLAVINDQTIGMGGLSKEVRDGINKILDEQMARATEEIRTGKGAIDALVAELMQKNHLSGKEIADIFAQNTSA